MKTKKKIKIKTQCPYCLKKITTLVNRPTKCSSCKGKFIVDNADYMAMQTNKFRVTCPKCGKVNREISKDEEFNCSTCRTTLILGSDGYCAILTPTKKDKKNELQDLVSELINKLKGV